jgi:PhzF family phenazine biosynthesis protein
MGQQIITVDAFTRVPFTGNPAAVCVVGEALDEHRMQLIAREMNYAETAFVCPAGKRFSLRWFTPTTEVDLCGHATLASAHVLWETAKLAPTEVALFDTKSGQLTARRIGEWIELDFPTTPVTPSEPIADLSSILGARVIGEYRSAFDLMVELENERAVAELVPDLTSLAKIAGRGIVVTAQGEQCDFVSRFFAPQSGVPEDPVTGSTHCALGEFWAKRLGKSDLVARQLSVRRGEIRVCLRGPRTLLQGQAITVLRAELMV